MGRRTVLLVAALVVAGLGAAAVFLYANNAKNEGDAAQQLVSVLVAKSQITAGTTGSTASSNGAFQQASVRAADVVPGALSEVTPIANLVATVPIFPGQQIISSQWSTSGATSGLSFAPGTVAMSVQLGDPERVAGFVSPGATVAIVMNGNDPKTNEPFTRTLLSNIPVIAVGPSTVVSRTTSTSGDATATNTEQIPTAILTLGVTQAQAEKIIFAQSGGDLHFALMNKDSKVTPGSPGINFENLFK